MKKDTSNSSAAALSACTAIAVDLAKRVFQVAGEDAQGQLCYDNRIRSREAFQAWLDGLPAGRRVLMETGPGAQAWARRLQSQGHQALILPAQRVAEHRSGAKNDRNDALAILRAGRDRSIAAVPIKSEQALAMQALHRVRQGCVRRRTALANQMRGLLLEHGISLAQGDAALMQGVSRALDDPGTTLPELFRLLLEQQMIEWQQQQLRIQAMTAQLQAVARQAPKALQLMSVRGIGPITATALIAKECAPERFANARQFAAYFGVVPDQHSSGNKVLLGKMSKRGDGYLRSLMIEGAHAVLRHLSADSHKPDDRRLLRWVQRHGSKGAAVRLANRNLRIVWVLLQSDQLYSPQAGSKAHAHELEGQPMHA